MNGPAAACDVLVDADSGLKTAVYTASPGIDDQSKLDLARVAGARPVGAHPREG